MIGGASLVWGSLPGSRPSEFPVILTAFDFFLC